MKITPKLLKLALNFYPPYIGAGVKVEYIREDWKEMRVSMSIHWYNRNIFGTHFGGSLYSMIDPHTALLLIQLLGKDYWIWDRSAGIKFIKATKDKVSSVIKIPDETLKEIKDKTAHGDKYLPKFVIDTKDESDNLVARFEKEIYVRKKQD